MMTTTSLVLWLVDTTLKGSLMILLVAAIQWMIGSRVDARWRHLLWVVVLLRLVMPQAPASSLSLFNLLPAAEPIAFAARAAIVEPPPPDVLIATAQRGMITITPSPVPAALRWAFWIWLCGALFFALRMLIASTHARRVVASGQRHAAPGELPIVECDLVRAPALHGLFRPVLLLPRGFLNTFTSEELRHVVLHETWHMKRMDVAVSWLLAAAQSIHWFNPLVWFAASRIREERELSCDELALSLLEEEERTGYGRTILKLLERFRPVAPVPALVGIVNQKQKMKRRLTMIASFRNGTRFTALFLTLVAAVGVAGLTDAQGTRRIIRKLDPTSVENVERLHQRVSFELTNASFGDLLNEVGNKIGAPVLQSPSIATSAIQNARFTLKADNVPAHAVLMEALMPFELSVEPTEAGITVSDEPAVRRIFVRGHGEHSEEDVIVTNGDKREVKRVIKVLEGKQADGELNERILVKKINADGHGSFDESGKLRRELTLKLDENGVKSEGKLTIEITK